MSDHQAEHDVATMCRVLGVSRSGYYASRGRAPSKRDREDAALTERVREIHERSRQTYGSPRIHAELRYEGLHIGRKRVERLMRQAGIEGVSRRKRAKTTKRSQRQAPAADLVDRDFTADAPDQLWVADITYVPTWTGFLYLAVVLDVWSRRIVGWSMATTLHTKIVLDALEMAVRQRQPLGVVHHSDQGCQYTSLAFGRRCREAGVRPSMGSVGDAYDNAMCESFFATLETELIDRTSFSTKSAVRSAVGGVRLHRGLLQSAAATLLHRGPVAHRVREAATAGGRRIIVPGCPPNRGNSSKGTPA